MVVTLGIKNVVVGAIHKDDKPKIHTGYLPINLTLARLAAEIPIHLVVVDGRVGMEGDGPVFGKPKPWGVAVVGTNAVEADSLTAYLMGFDPRKIGYLVFAEKLGLGRIVTGFDEYRTSFQPHQTIEKQYSWIEEAKKAGLL